MDSSKRNEKEQNPREKASILSIITFFYNYRLFKKGRKKTLEDEDIYEIPSWLSSEKLGNKLEDSWTEQKKLKENPSLLYSLFLVFGKGYFFLGLIQLTVKTTIIIEYWDYIVEDFNDLDECSKYTKKTREKDFTMECLLHFMNLSFIQPKALSKVVAYFQPNQKNVSEGDLYTYGIILITLILFSTIYNHNFQQFQTEIAVRVRTSVAALIFRKALKLGPNALSTIGLGKIVTLITKDIFSFDNALTFVNDMWIGVIHVITITVIIYQRIGLSVFGGIGFYLLIIPLQLYVGKRVSEKRVQAAKKSDERLQLTTETIRNIKTIKMFTWENFFFDKLKQLRKSELGYLSPVYYLKAVVLVIAATATNLSFFLLIMTYIWTGHFTDAETVYFIQTCYQSLRSYIQVSIPFGIAQCSDMLASVKRLTDFLMAEEMVEKRTSARFPRVFMKNVSSQIEETEVIKDISFNVKENTLLLITGNLGSGKSSIIKTLLGEYPTTGGQMLIDGTISYAPEEPWLFPSTIKQNILFGQDYDEKRYHEVLNVCALTEDINKLEKGDQTIVGDRGINFSKGQQARINLARAIYRESDIYLIDDCLSALDSKVNGYIFKKCMMEFLKDKIVILVTNNINHIKLVYGNNILVVENGRTLSLDKQKETLDKRITYYIDDIDMDYYEEENTINPDEILEEPDENTQLLTEQIPNLEKNLYHEYKKSGKVNISVYLRYYKHAGGVIMLVILALIFISTQAAVSYSEKVVSWWVNIEPNITALTKANKTNTTEYETVLEKRHKLLNIYSIMIVSSLVLMTARIYMNFYFALKASKNLHKKMLNSVLNAFMSFFDKNLVGNVVNRFSKDLMTMDEVIPLVTYDIFRNTLAFLGIIYLVLSVNTIFIIPTIILMVKLYFLMKFYIPTGRSIKRLEASSRSPMIGYLNATLDGLSAIRAYGKQTLLISEFDKHLDHYTSASYMVTCTSRFYAFSLDMMSSTFSLVVIVKFMIFKDSTAGDVGLAISQATALSGLLQFVVRQYTELENNMTGIERVLEYTDIDKENKVKGTTYTNWPTHGQLEYKNVSLTYNTTNLRVLKNVSFVINPKENVGIVGRTGAGKSSIISTLFRLYDIEGSILIDDVDTKILSLQFLRANIAIIPQNPILFSGTIRSNLDPPGKHSDEELWQAIKKTNLQTLFLSLDEEINVNGANYSSGQRQLICLARALVSKNKIIVLDEATSNMDPETSRLLQTVIKQHFSSCTVLTIAHKLNTVMDCDRVMVVDHGEIIEYDTPASLKRNKGGTFYKMIQHSGLQE